MVPPAVEVSPAASIDEVITRMEAIDSALPPTDGIACFNRMYLAVTRLVAQHIDDGRFADGAFMADFDVVFANLYLGVVGNPTAPPVKAPRSWKPLFDRRADMGISSMQFAVAGMNAHINHDLPIALVDTCRRRNTSPTSPPHRADYLEVDHLLEGVEQSVRQSFETGVVREIDTHIAAVADVISNWSIVEAREAAWTNAQALWELARAPVLQRAYLDTLDGTVGFAGRGLLVPLP